MSDEVKHLTENDKEYIQWFEEARKQTLDTLLEFLTKLSSKYSHTHVTSCHAIAAAAIATATAMGDKLNSGYSNIETNFIMWDFVKNWQYGGEDLPLKIYNYEQMLYPQFKEKFEKIISKETWEWIQTQAKNLLNANPDAVPKLKEHWENITKGNVPFGYKIKQNK